MQPLFLLHFFGAVWNIRFRQLRTNRFFLRFQDQLLDSIIFYFGDFEMEPINGHFSILRRQFAERVQYESELPRNVQTTLRKLEARRQGIFLSKAENGTCLCCFVRIRPQVFQEIRLATKIHTCDSCRRFLYHEPSLRQNRDTTSASGEVEALNGGTV